MGEYDSEERKKVERRKGAFDDAFKRPDDL